MEEAGRERKEKRGLRAYFFLKRINYLLIGKVHLMVMSRDYYLGSISCHQHVLRCWQI
jgi:hypothetical protein